MAEKNYSLMTNKELNEEYDRLVETFRNAQTILKENYLIMVSSAEESVKIKEILNKREGKNKL